MDSRGHGFDSSGNTSKMGAPIPIVHSHRRPAVPTALKPRKTPSQGARPRAVDAIVEAAIRILRRNGWAGLTTTRVAGLAGVSVGSLYQYFPQGGDRRRDRASPYAPLSDGGPGRRLHRRRRLSSWRGAPWPCSSPRSGAHRYRCLRDNLAALQGRQASSRKHAPSSPPCRRRSRPPSVSHRRRHGSPSPSAAVEGAVWEILTQDQAALDQPETEAALARLFTSIAKPRTFQ